jgi:hypothetical protein
MLEDPFFKTIESTISVARDVNGDDDDDGGINQPTLLPSETSAGVTKRDCSTFIPSSGSYTTTIGPQSYQISSADAGGYNKSPLHQHLAHAHAQVISSTTVSRGTHLPLRKFSQNICKFRKHWSPVTNE